MPTFHSPLMTPEEKKSQDDLLDHVIDLRANARLKDCVLEQQDAEIQDAYDRILESENRVSELQIENDLLKESVLYLFGEMGVWDDDGENQNLPVE